MGMDRSVSGVFIRDNLLTRTQPALEHVHHKLPSTVVTLKTQG